MKKKLMLLGGSRFLIPVIEKAHELGVFVITADYIPDNVAHQFADDYINVSVIDQQAVLEAAKEKNIDGIMAFACDPGVVTASFVAEQMNLPFQCSYRSACIMQDKQRFRQFLREHGFNSPFVKGYISFLEAMSDAHNHSLPVVIKPADSAGSKGVTKVSDISEYENAVEYAFENSISKKIIVEEYLDLIGFQSSTDIFVVNGTIHYPLLSDQVFDEDATNPFVPTAEIWPSTMPNHYQQELTKELNRLFALLQCSHGIYNVECRVCSNGKIYIMEVSPRGGGNHIAKLQDDAYGLNYIENEVRAAVRLPMNVNKPKAIRGNWCTCSIHPRKNQLGKLKSITFSNDIKERIKFADLSFLPDKEISPFTGANMAFGDVILQCDTREELLRCISLTSDSLKLSPITESLSK